MVRNERRGNSAEAEAELVIKRNMYNRGGDWGGGGEREELLGAYFIPSS